MTFFKVIFGHLSYQIMVVGPLVVGLFILGTKQNLLPSEIISWNYLLPSWTHQPIRGQPGQCPPLWLLVQFSHSVMSDPLWPHGLQHARPPCLSPTHRVYSNSCTPSRWCHPTVSSSVVPFSSFLQSFPASGSFPNESVIHPQVAKVLELQFQHQSFQWIFRTDLL